jgi:hypothetical protein
MCVNMIPRYGAATAIYCGGPQMLQMPPISHPLVRTCAGLARRLLITCCAAFCLAQAQASTTISTDGAGVWDGATSAHTFGFPHTTTYGQVITATASDQALIQFTLYTSMPQHAGYRGIVFPWDASKAHATDPALYISGVRCGHGVGSMAPEVFVPPTPLALTVGQTYVLAITASYDGFAGNPCGSSTIDLLTGAIGYTNADTYGSGAFYYLDNGADTTGFTGSVWTLGFGANDLAFNAVLDTIPCPACAILTPASNFYSARGSNANGSGFGQVTVSVPNGGPWTATSNADWLTVVSGASGAARGSVVFSVAPNAGNTQRTGTMTIGARTFTVVQAAPVTSQANAVLVEYYNATLDDYFITAGEAEVAALDAAAAIGGHWKRTGLTFKSGGSDPVYRFNGNQTINPETGATYGPPSHFYTVDLSEQSWLQAFAVPPIWVLEAPTAESGWFPNFYMTQPGLDRQCPAGMIPVYRAAHGPSHRFTTILSALNEVLARGWTNEGISMCAPQ